MKKFILATIFAVFVTAVMMTTGAMAATIVASGECGANGDDVTWTLDSEGTLTISGEGWIDDYKFDSFDSAAPWHQTAINQDIKKVIINEGVMAIGKYAFYRCESLTSVTIPNSLERIYDYAFSNTGLANIYIPGSVEYIGDKVFNGCKGLTSINVDSNNDSYLSENGVLFNKDKTAIIRYPAGKTDKSYVIPNSVGAIWAGAFQACRNLTNVTIPDSVTHIDNNAFSGCSGLTDIELPRSLEYIGMGAFSNCTGLASIEIPENVIIEDSLFYGCTGLTSINVDSNNDSYSSENGVLFNKDKTELICYPDGKEDKSYTIPNGVLIWHNAFSKCINLTSINVDSNNDSYLSENGVLFNKDKTELISYPAGKTDKSYTIPDGVTRILGNAFSGCENLKSVTIPDSMNVINTGAFVSCIGLKSITIPSGVYEIENHAFDGCTGLTNVHIPLGVSRIGPNAFYSCTGLTSIVIPESVWDIYEFAFYGCENLKDVYYGGTQEEWEDMIMSEFNYGNRPLLNATIHFNSEGPKNYIDPDSGIIADAPADAIESGVTFVVEKVDQAPANIDINGVLYDIYFEKDGESVQPKGEVTVSIPVPAGKEGDKCKVYYIDSSGNKTDMNAKHENGYLVFKTDHFSFYSVEEIEATTKKGDVDNNGKVEGKDKAILNRYLAGWEGYDAMILNWDAADIDGNGEVKGRDKAILNRYLAGWEGYDKYFEN